MASRLDAINKAISSATFLALLLFPRFADAQDGRVCQMPDGSLRADYDERFGTHGAPFGGEGMLTPDPCPITLTQPPKEEPEQPAQQIRQVPESVESPMQLTPQLAPSRKLIHGRKASAVEESETLGAQLAEEYAAAQEAEKNCDIPGRAAHLNKIALLGKKMGNSEVVESAFSKVRHPPEDCGKKQRECQNLLRAAGEYTNVAYRVLIKKGCYDEAARVCPSCGAEASSATPSGMSLNAVSQIVGAAAGIAQGAQRFAPQPSYGASSAPLTAQPQQTKIRPSRPGNYYDSQVTGVPR